MLKRLLLHVSPPAASVLLLHVPLAAHGSAPPLGLAAMARPGHAPGDMRAMAIDRIGPISPLGPDRDLDGAPTETSYGDGHEGGGAVGRSSTELGPLVPTRMPVPTPSSDQVLIRVSRCGVCHTELDEIEGRTPPPRLPVVPGHEIVGRVAELGSDVTDLSVGDRAGVGWIYDSDGSERENLSPSFRATGRDSDGGYAQYVAVGQRYAHRIPDVFTDEEAAPLLCAGGVGYRALSLTGIRDGMALGLMGFGGSGHIVLQLAKHMYPNVGVYVFARSGPTREFARSLGADWAGGTDDVPPEFLDAVIDTTPAWGPVLASLKVLKPGGRLVINAIRKEGRDAAAMAGIDYAAHLWMEKEIKTVANVTGRDLREFLEVAARIPLRPRVTTYRLEDANFALRRLKGGNVQGAFVLKID